MGVVAGGARRALVDDVLATGGTAAAAASLVKGLGADVTIIDPEREFVYTADQVVSKSRNTPFLGWRLKGRAVLTMVGGEVRYRLPG